MGAPKRATIYLEAQLHRALRLKSADRDTTISALVNAAVRDSLAADIYDLGTSRADADEPRLSFDSFVRDLKHRGDL